MLMASGVANRHEMRVKAHAVCWEWARVAAEADDNPRPEAIAEADK
jgi:hypothetical protein